MSRVPLPRRLSLLLGAEIGTIKREHLERLVGLREDDDLEVKSQLYGNSDRERRELAADVAAFANGRGGLLLIGGSTTGDVIDGITATNCPEDEELRIRQILAELVVPFVEIEIQVIAEPEEQSLIVISVGPSEMAPHAVRVGSALRYVVRSGPGKRPISEPEVSSLYRRRFEAAQSRTKRLTELHRSLGGELAGDSAWLVISSLPERPGRLRLTHESVGQFRKWLQDVERTMPTDLAYSAQNLTVGIQRLIAYDLNRDGLGPARWRFLDLHTDGAGTLAIPIGDAFRPGGISALADAELAVDDERLCVVVMSALLLLARHAERTGAFGYLSLLAGLRCSEEHSLVLVHERQHVQQSLPGVRAIADAEEVGHTFDVALLCDAGPALVSAAYLVVADLVAAFGLPAPLQITDDGQIRTKFTLPQHLSRLRPWCDEHGVALTDD